MVWVKPACQQRTRALHNIHSNTQLKRGLDSYLWRRWQIDPERRIYHDRPKDIFLAKVAQRDSDIHSGDLEFAGTRVPGDKLVSCLKVGYTIQGSLQVHPTVERRQLESYLELSHQRLAHLTARNESTS